VGSLPTTQGNYKYAAVAVEYFTKWIEAKPLINITSETIRKFFWQNIICRFGVPREITVDNGKQFDSQLFREFCYSVGTKTIFASIYHRNLTGPSKGPTASSSAASKSVCLIRKRANGPMNSRRSSGPTTLQNQGQRSSPHSGYSMVPKQ